MYDNVIKASDHTSINLLQTANIDRECQRLELFKLQHILAYVLTCLFLCSHRISVRNCVFPKAGSEMTENVSHGSDRPTRCPQPKHDIRLGKNEKKDGDKLYGYSA